tara:strand:- start:11834 stop:13921 length:2088 start_codon:yes stop_codon:yes gene_type:complete
MAGGFTSGFDPQIFDFAGHRLRKQELRLKERQINKKQGKEGEKMKQSAVRQSQIDPKFQEKFMPGQEELMRQLDAYAAKYANELNHKNTATDDIEGEFSNYHWSVYRNMERQIEDFADHTTAYITDYKAFYDKVYEVDEFGNNVYNLDLVEQDEVYLTKEMVESKMGRDESGNIIENMDDYSWMWNAEGTAYDDGMGQQTALKNENGEYQYELGPNGEQYLLGENGKRLTAYELNANNEVSQTKSGVYKFESIYNQEYNPKLLRFDIEGNIIYGEEGSETPFYKQWSREFTQVDKKKYSTNGLYEISQGLKFDILRDEAVGGTNSYITPEAMNGLWDQAISVSGWDRNASEGRGDWQNDYGTISSNQVADAILAEQGNNNPSEGARSNIIRMIQQGSHKDNEGNLLGELPEELKRSSKYAPGRTLETYQDYMVEMILEQWKARHASVDIKNPTLTGVENKSLEFDWTNAGVQSTVINIGSEGATTNNDMGGVNSLDRDVNIDRPWKPTDINQINDHNDVGFQAFDPTVTKILQKGGAQGEIMAGTMGHRAIDKRTGQLMHNATWDKATGSFIFANQEDADNAMIVFGFDGYWKARNPDDITKLYTGDKDGVLEKWESITIEEILANDKGIPGFFPINTSTLSTQELKIYQEGIDRSKDIKKVIIEDGQRREIAMGDDSIINEEWGFPGADETMIA